MRTPFRYLIGITVGIVVGFLLETGTVAADIVDIVVDLSMRIGRYLLLPLIFFSFPVAVTQLRRLKKLGSAAYRSLLYIVFSAAVLTVLGTMIAWIINIGRIPAIPGNPSDFSVMELGSVIEETIRMNSFRVFVGNSFFILPLLLPAFLLGWHMYHDREIAEPVFNFFDSFSRLLYRINYYILVLMPGMLAFLSMAVVIQARQVVDFQRFIPLIAVSLGLVIVLLGGLFPFMLKKVRENRSPWKTIASLSDALTGALVSASPLFNYGNLTKNLKEKLKIRRHSAAFMIPIYLMFARAGTAMISAICMLTVIRSYSSLEITLFQAAWTALFSFLVSFLLLASPERGLSASLIILGKLYGRGLDDGWLILAPVLPLLTMLTALLDTVVSVLLLLLVNKKIGLEEAGANNELRV